MARRERDIPLLQSRPSAVVLIFRCFFDRFFFSLLIHLLVSLLIPQTIVVDISILTTIVV